MAAAPIRPGDPGLDALDRELNAESARFWQSAAGRLAREINLGWWLSGWLPWAVASGLVGTFAMLYARFRGLHPGWVWGGLAAVLAAAAVAAWHRGRSRFESSASARVRLEESLGLRARLSAAAAGEGTWPAPPAAVAWPVRWRWQRPAAWAGVVAALLALASRVPVSAPQSANGGVIEKPSDARVVEQWLDAVRREHAADERSVDRVRERIAELMERPRDQWYEHASLEAAGTIREQTAADLQEMFENLAKAEQAAAQLREMTEAVPQDMRDALAKDLKLAALALEMGAFKPPADLAELLRGLEGRDLRDLPPAECRGLCRKLGQQLAENREALERALAECPDLDLDAIPMAGDIPVQGPGRGGVARGRDDAELTLGEEHDLGTKGKQKVNQPLDLERAAPDELLAVVEGEHEIDETAYTGPRAGGVARAGDGGSAAEVDALLPAEQAAVRRFFE